MQEKCGKCREWKHWMIHLNLICIGRSVALHKFLLIFLDFALEFCFRIVTAAVSESICGSCLSGKVNELVGPKQPQNMIEVAELLFTSYRLHQYTEYIYIIFLYASPSSVVAEFDSSSSTVSSTVVIWETNTILLWSLGFEHCVMRLSKETYILLYVRIFIVSYLIYIKYIVNMILNYFFLGFRTLLILPPWTTVKRWNMPQTWGLHDWKLHLPILAAFSGMRIEL